MHIYTDKAKQNKSQLIPHVESQKHTETKSTIQIEDNRPESITQRKLQQKADNSFKISRLTTFQSKADNKLKATVDNQSTQQKHVSQRAEADIDTSGITPTLSGLSDAATKKGINHTKVSYTADTLTSTGETVGVSMIANPIGPDHPQGSAPDTNVTKKQITRMNKQDTYIRGHLLNGDIGGPGMAQNLFPITAQANSQHYHAIEKHVESWVNDQKWYVYYKVDVTNRDDKKGEATFECEAYPIDSKGKPTQGGVQASILSKPQASASNAVAVNVGNKNKPATEAALTDDDIEYQKGKAPVGYRNIEGSVESKMYSDIIKQNNSFEKNMVALGFTEKAIEGIWAFVATNDPAVFKKIDKGTWNGWVKQINSSYP